MATLSTAAGMNKKYEGQSQVTQPHFPTFLCLREKIEDQRPYNWGGYYFPRDSPPLLGFP